MKEKLLEKWIPVIGALFTDDDFSEDFKYTVCEYAEHHSKIEFAPGYDNGDYDQMLLPSSLKVISKLNLGGIDIKFIDKKVEDRKKKFKLLLDEEYEDSYEINDFTVSIKKHDYIDMISYGLGTERYESALIEEMVRTINKQLETATTMNIYLLISKFEILDDDKYIKISFTSIIKIK
jgi:hypothetical protein